MKDYDCASNWIWRELFYSPGTVLKVTDDKRGVSLAPGRQFFLFYLFTPLTV